MLKIPTNKIRLNESGYSLIEVIASIILITIILLSFFTLLINSAKTTKTSESIVDYTYLAQKEMENAYEKSALSTSEKWEDIKNDIPSLGYTFLEEKNGYTIFKKTIIEENVDVLLKIKMHEPTKYVHLTKIIIEVYDAETSILKSQLETILSWGD
ncbi:hypothetical protein ACIQ2D_01795 [Lysinibacillus sp. NPDC097287]|uniref:hypothetical protein n=1 Tax=Lysinibacillus sp. NPDC097287 TaxID=3364144 RepID=UPI00382BF069